MGKNKGGKSKGYISSGQVRTVNKKIQNAIRRDYMASQDRFINQMEALKKGKDVVLTIANPNKEQTNQQFIRVRVSGKEYLNRMKGKV